ncbi:MAG: ketopantoate reductase family protein [Gemmataceae bacterium]|nr:ketopantoate reductase family protein [Gemmataceae bacterium]
MKRIHVVGAGGIGIALARALLTAGHNSLLLVESCPEKLEYGARHGIQVNNSLPQKIDLAPFQNWRPEPNEIVLLCVKCYDNPPILSRLPGDCFLVPVQNGFDPVLESQAPPGEGIASFISECEQGTTRTRITRKGMLHLGPLKPWANLERLAELRDLFRAGGIPVSLVPDILPYKNSKLLFNAAISPLTTAGGLDNAALLSSGPLRDLFFDFLLENHRILKTARQPMETIGPFHPDQVAFLLKQRFLAYALSPFFRLSLRQTYCSMYGDLKKGITEVRNYNGRLEQLAIQAGAPCPLNSFAVQIIESLAASGESPSPSHLQGFHISSAGY